MVRCKNLRFAVLVERGSSQMAIFQILHKWIVLLVSMHNSDFGVTVFDGCRFALQFIRTLRWCDGGQKYSAVEVSTYIVGFFCVPRSAMISSLPRDIWLVVLDMLFVERSRTSIAKLSLTSKTLRCFSASYLFHYLFIYIDGAFTVERIIETFTGGQYLRYVRHAVFNGALRSNVGQRLPHWFLGQDLDIQTMADVLTLLPVVNTVEFRRIQWTGCVIGSGDDEETYRPRSFPLDRAFSNVRGLWFEDVRMSAGLGGEVLAQCFPHADYVGISPHRSRLERRWRRLVPEHDSLDIFLSDVVTGWFSNDDHCPSVKAICLAGLVSSHSSVLRSIFGSCRSTLRALSMEVDLSPFGESI